MLKSMPPEVRQALLLAGAMLGYALLMTASPIWQSLRDGARCLARHQRIWGLPAAFALSHALFRQWVRWVEWSWTPGAPPFVTGWRRWQTVAWSDALAKSWLAAAECTAGLFNCLVDSFPLSALAALLFLVNWRGYRGALHRALRRRLGWTAATGVSLGLWLCALAALVKPVLFGGLPSLNTRFGAQTLLRAGEVVNWLGFIFEYLLGVALQIYLVLLSFVWVRGLSFHFEELRRFALRRFAFALKWSGVILALSVLGISLPRMMAGFHPDLDAAGQMRVERWITVARWALALFILAFCAVQITLIFHNESLRRAILDHCRLARHHAWAVFWMLLVVFGHFLALTTLDAFLRVGLGESAWPALLWSLLEPLLWAGLAGWFLSGWVCLFRRCETGRTGADHLVEL